MKFQQTIIKKIIRYECQQPWDVTTEDYRPLLDVYELDLKDRVLKELIDILLTKNMLRKEFTQS